MRTEPQRHLILTVLVLFFTVLLLSSAAHANGRQPCDRGAGGISHCMGDKFICNDGRVSGSKRTCNPAVHGTAPKKEKGKKISLPRQHADQGQEQ